MFHGQEYVRTVNNKYVMLDRHSHCEGKNESCFTGNKDYAKCIKCNSHMVNNTCTLCKASIVHNNERKCMRENVCVKDEQLMNVKSELYINVNNNVPQITRENVTISGKPYKLSKNLEAVVHIVIWYE